MLPRGRQAAFEAPFLVPSESPQFRPQNTLTYSITAQPEPRPRGGETSRILVAGCSRSPPRQGWSTGGDAGGSEAGEEKVGEEGEVDQGGEEYREG